MIKATGRSKDGTPLLILGLSAENTKRLHANQPIMVRADHVDPRLPVLTVVLVAGDTEQVIADALESQIIQMDLP
jgi:hypothetical protein